MSTKELVKVSSVSEKIRDFYKLSIRDTNSNKIEDIILHNPNIKDYCKQNNISLKYYEYSLPAYGWSDLIGVIDSYITEYNYKYKLNEVE